MSASRPEIAILGGSFNPVHNGHLRVAVEVLEAFGPSRLDLLPSAIPPHKDRGVLPFALRLEMLRLACGELAKICVRELEARRPGPSYTRDTLHLYAHHEPDARPLFIMGVPDFLTLPQWREWREIPLLANMVLVNRLQHDRSMALEFARQNWPAAREDLAAGPEELTDTRGIDYLPLFTANEKECARIYFLDMPRFDISASMIRERWLAGRMLHGLVPGPVREYLAANAGAVNAVWNDPDLRQGQHPLPGGP